MLKKVFIAIHVLLIALVAFGLSGVSQATGIDRQFAITIDPLNPAPGSTHTYTLTITNDLLTGQKNQIQNIVVTVPSGFTLASTNPVIAPTGWSVTVSGNVVTLSTTNAFQLSPGQSLSIGINATAPNMSVTCPSSTT